MAQQILNLKVPQNFNGCRQGFEPPAQTLQTYADRLRLPGRTVGMMTAASMQSFRMQQDVCENIPVAAVVTCGLSNAKRIGEPAEWRYVDATPPRPGTINIIAVIDAALTPAAMVEAVMMTTEAKAACLQALGVKSPRSGLPATGTVSRSLARNVAPPISFKPPISPSRSVRVTMSIGFWSSKSAIMAKKMTRWGLL